MTMLAELLSTVFERRYRSGTRPDRDNRDIETLCADLLSDQGEVAGLSLARRILDRFAAMDDAAKTAFFTHMAEQLDIDPEAVRTTLAAYEAAPDRASYSAYMKAAEPPRQELIRRLNQAPGATGRLVAMRSDLRRLAKGGEGGQERPGFAALDQDFRHLFTSWFNRGFLVLRPINWDSPAAILEKIIAYEAVHAIDTWEGLRLRLAPPDRRCFAFFHPAMPDEPLIFVEVALTRGAASSIQAVLAENREAIAPEEADTAVFYSISNCQPGLAGVSFGNSLIKQVAQDLGRELPNLKTYVTLSPIPGLARWLEQLGKPLDPAAPPEPATLRALAAHYLTEARRSDKLPVDPVARFHLGNGALVHAVHAEADLSPKGLAQSGGAMVNYLYDLSRITQNSEAFVGRHQIAASPQVRTMARSAETTDA
ncbi:decarboxylase [Brevirhabdus pacifica]|uniref:Decarboxylase n=1 Tax=Brevirhabdus pacifica TaxID=1267768 RepID=A0A1U7DFT4_9RHOB|nr:malonyl-CoA decarboxylase [Brevirhabdus pacifica]APX88832.1 decarboxylase [Brevirhabdus pacifica]OWU80074.1 decarboxylase [Loktanella sp. 22II-4b]PJJ86632.1 malonyl-CoA decarboxylase [Brevirhabdus pacifica]